MNTNTVSSLAKLSAYGGLNKGGSADDISGMLGRLSSKWSNMDPRAKHSLVGALGGGALGGGAGYLLADKDSKGRGALAGMLAGAGIGGVGGYAAGNRMAGEKGLEALEASTDQGLRDAATGRTDLADDLGQEAAKRRSGDDSILDYSRYQAQYNRDNWKALMGVERKEGTVDTGGALRRAIPGITNPLPFAKAVRERFNPVVDSDP